MRTLRYLRRKQTVSPFETDTLASQTDMTGMIPAGLENDEQALSYESMYPMVKQKPKDD